MDNKRNTELKLVKNEDGLIQIIGALDYTSVRIKASKLLSLSMCTLND